MSRPGPTGGLPGKAHPDNWGLTERGGGPRGTEVSPWQEAIAPAENLPPWRPRSPTRPPAPALQHHGPDADKSVVGFPQAGHRPRRSPEATLHQTPANAAKPP